MTDASGSVAEQSTKPIAAPRDAPVPLSFPSFLRNPKFSHLNVHLLNHHQAGSESPLPKKKDPRDKEGKRRIRRLENSRFSFNPHVVQPTKRDFAVPITQVQSTFPVPLPPYLPRVSSAPAAITPELDPVSTFAGKFSHSLRGSRRELRRRRGQAEPLIRAVEAELCEWLAEPGKLLDVKDYMIVGGIREVRRSPMELVWDVDQDAFARYVVHCAARWYDIVSFSKEQPDGTRLTHLLRPNPTRPGRAALATPPTTDWDTASVTCFSAFATDASEVESLAGVGDETIKVDREGLNSIVSSDNIPTALQVAPLGSRARSNSETGYENEGDESGDDGWVSLRESITSLSLVTEEHPDRTTRAEPPMRDLSRESSRPPSCRPHARPKRRIVGRPHRAHTVPLVARQGIHVGSLWEYLFA